MFKRTLTNIGAGVALAAAGVLATGAAAYAHECFNPNRSDQGNAGASNSQAWFTVHVEEITEGMSEEDASCFLEAYASTGAPSSFTIHVKGVNGQDGVIAGNNPHPEKAGDGKGIDEIFAAHGADIGFAFESCGIPAPF
ncbi:hypothetical protein [Agromyces mariniharenae]|uniref:Uncharacterized protein n=1 Tax=Agromyces mariniharenae TaxID=2604423 RepID=A0A5S4V4V6_9MICO|nr:hypothetical protein [Agromyces mariniharenae]TYL53218.1 hypothetical protein FYC51_05855 [Agromyces mariniharenae]